MKQSNDALRESHQKYNSRGRALCTTLLAAAFLMGMGLVQASNDVEDIPELPGFDVRPIWTLHGLEAPAPVKVVVPLVGRGMTGTEIRMYFRIETDGTVSHIKSNASLFNLNECNLSAQMTAVLSYWEFTPALDKNGDPVEVKVALPVMVVEEEEANQDHYASISCKRPILIAAIDR
jgi:hypothetical protein